VAWLHAHHPHALPRVRAEVSGTEPTRPSLAARRPPTEHARMFGDSVDGRARSDAFIGPDGGSREVPPGRPG
jgi:hypothetical protein